MSVQRRLMANSITNSRNQNSAYSNKTPSSLKTNSNIRFVSSNDHFETTRDHHKRKKNTKKFVKIFIITYLNFYFVYRLPCISMSLFILLVLVIIGVILCILLINSNQKKKTIPNKESVLRWNLTGITIAGVSSVSGTDNMHLNAPLDLALDYKDTMFIADYNNHRIQRYVRGSMNGTTVAGFGNGTSSTSLFGLLHPSHVIVDDEENLYITNYDNDRILYWPRNALSGIVAAGFGKKKS